MLSYINLLAKSLIYIINDLLMEEQALDIYLSGCIGITLKSTYLNQWTCEIKVRIYLSCSFDCRNEFYFMPVTELLYSDFFINSF